MNKQFQQYNLITELAQKHSHTTYLAASDQEPEQQVVVIAFAPTLCPYPHEQEMLRRYVERLQHLHHPSIAPLLESCLEDGQLFLVRDYLPGETLRTRLRKAIPKGLDLREALTILQQIGQALAYAHQQDLLHGNLKPENVLFDASGRAILSDFSLVARTELLIPDQMTEDYAFCYMAPEQFAGVCDVRSDQYALGCLAYELLTGQVPFLAQGLAQMQTSHSLALPMPLSQHRADLPPSLEAAVLKTMSKDPDARFHDFSLFLEIVQSVLSPPPSFPLTRTARVRTKKNHRPERPAEAAIDIQASNKPEPRGAIPVADPSLPETVSVESGFSTLQKDKTSSPRTPIDTNEGTLSTGAKTSEPEETSLQDPWVAILQGEEAEMTPSVDEQSSLQLSSEAATEVLPTAIYLDGQEHDEPPTRANDHFLDQQIPARRGVVQGPPVIPKKRDRRRAMALTLVIGIIIASSIYAFWPLMINVPEASLRMTAILIPHSPKPNQTPAPGSVMLVPIPAQGAIIPTAVSPGKSIATPTLTATPKPTATSTPVKITNPAPAPAMPTPTPIPLQTTTIDDSVQGSGMNQFNYVGSSWGHCTNGCQGVPGVPSDVYNNGESWANAAGDYVTITFTGVQIQLYGVIEPDGGFGAFSIDGGSETIVNYYSHDTQSNRSMWTSPTLPEGTHTLKLRSTGNKTYKSSNTYIIVDYVDILSQ